MASILTDLKNRFKQGDIATRFIFVNAGIFLVLMLAKAASMVALRFDIVFHPYRWLECPAQLGTLLTQPWSLVTYMFLHADALHLLFNMLWLSWFGKLFLYFFSSKHFRGVYILGGLCGGILYILAYNILPFQTATASGYLLGASASVLAIAVATAVREPDFRVNLLLIGTVRLKHLTLVLVATDLLLLLITSDNSGGHIAHLGGALAGFWFAYALKQGYDPTKWINHTIDAVSRWFDRKPKTHKRPDMKAHFGGRAADYEFNAQKKKNDAEVDRILEKLKKSGYESLTAEEKKSLFDASKRYREKEQS